MLHILFAFSRRRNQRRHPPLEGRLRVRATICRKRVALKKAESNALYKASDSASFHMLELTESEIISDQKRVNTVNAHQSG